MCNTKAINTPIGSSGHLSHYDGVPISDPSGKMSVIRAL